MSKRQRTGDERTTGKQILEGMNNKERQELLERFRQLPVDIQRKINAMGGKRKRRTTSRRRSIRRSRRRSSKLRRRASTTSKNRHHSRKRR